MVSVSRLRLNEVGFPWLLGWLNEVGFPAEAHRSTVGLRWGLLRCVRYGAVDTWSSDEEGFPQEGSFPRGRSGSRTARLQWRPHRP